MMTSIQTIQQTSAPTITTIYIKNNAEILKDLLDKLSASPIISDKQNETIHKYCKPTYSEKKIRNALYDIIQSILSPLVAREENQDEALRLILDIKKVLKKYLPEGKDITEYLEEQKKEEASIVFLTQVEVVVVKQNEQINNFARRVDERIESFYIETKQKIVKVESDKETMDKELREKTRSQFKKLEQGIGKFKDSAKSINSAGKRFEKQQATLRSTLKKHGIR